MKIKTGLVLSVLVPAFVAALLFGPGAAFTFAAIDGGYVGSSVCGTCHDDHYADFSKSGHPYKFKHTGGAAPTDPLSDLFPRPDASGLNTGTLGDFTCGDGLIVCDPGTSMLSWSAINYTVGGFGWKLRWGVKDFGQSGNPVDTKTGYVWAGTANQYKLETDNWSSMYNNSDKKYSCAICHSTNGTSSVDAGCTTALGSGRSEPWASNPGMDAANHGGYYSEWTFDGVQCEACHGPGEIHAGNPMTNPQGVLTTGDAEICAKCHTRSVNTVGLGGECGPENTFPATLAILDSGACIGAACSAGNFVGHHEQQNELTGVNGDGVHASLSCTNCHNPHKRTTTVVASVATALGITDNHLSAETRGAVASCESCHGAKPLQYPMGNISCVDCHMAEATSTANSSTGTWGKAGDMKTHIFKIDTAAATINRANGEGKIVAANYITVDYACGKCHDSSMNTFSGKALDRTTAQVTAKNIHLSRPAAHFVWYKDPVQSYTVNFDAARTNCGGPEGSSCTYAWDFGDGNIITGSTITSHTYPDATMVTVTLTVKNTTTNLGDSVSQTVTPVLINTAPVASKTTRVVSGMNVSFTDTSTDAQDAQSALLVTVQWGDGSSSTGAGGSVFSKTYTLAGNYTIKHSVTDTGGLKSSSANITITIAEKYSISGSVTDGLGAGVAGVKISLKQGSTVKQTRTTAADGSYSFTNLLKGCYIVVPSMTGSTFSPASSTLCIGPSASGIDFTVQ